MKRLLPIFPVLALIFLNACGNTVQPVMSDLMMTDFVQSLTATMWTPTPTQTPNLSIPTMINSLNNDLTIINPLESTLDADYRVIGISFSRYPDRSGMLFHVDVECRCMNDADCCIPERTFVVIIEAMKRNASTILPNVPADVSNILVVCTDHRAPVGAMTAPWQEVQRYLQSYITGYELGAHVSKTVVP